VIGFAFEGGSGALYVWPFVPLRVGWGRAGRGPCQRLSLASPRPLR
jgi:hypothetical protein